MKKGTCDRCHNYKWINKHHIYPKKYFSVKDNKETVQLCLDCHSYIHDELPKEKQKKSFYKEFTLKFLASLSILLIIFGIIKIFEIWYRKTYNLLS